MCRYKLVDIELQLVKKEKDLGVFVTSKFSWEPQVASLFNKATSRLGLLNRTWDNALYKISGEGWFPLLRRKHATNSKTNRNALTPMKILAQEMIVVAGR